MIDVKLLYPIGSIYMSIQDTNPSAFFGGTWERIAKGKTLVGVDENDSDFDASSKTGGEKEHILTIDEIPEHSHNGLQGVGLQFTGNGSDGGGIHLASTGQEQRIKTFPTGGNQPHNNIQPYYTCYIFVRTA